MAPELSHWSVSVAQRVVHRASEAKSGGPGADRKGRLEVTDRLPDPGIGFLWRGPSRSTPGLFYMHRRFPQRLLGLLAALSLAAPAAAQNPPPGFVGPFELGLRWLHAADLANPWLPNHVSFGAGGELVWVGTGVGERGVRLFATPSSGVVPQPEATDAALNAASFVLSAQAADDPSRLFSLAQFPEPDPFSRRTIVARHDALQASSGFGAAWSYAFGFLTNGPAQLDVDDGGDVVAAAALLPGAGVVRVARLDGATGQPLYERDLFSGGLDSIALSGDGAHVALGLGARLVVLDATGAIAHDELLGSTVTGLDFDAAGARLVVGLTGELRVYDRSGAVFALAALHAGDSNELASRVAIARDGETYAAAWWRFRALDRLRYEVYEGAGHVRTNHLVQPGLPGGPQNAPVGVALSADGSRIAFGSWGHLNGDPEVVLLGRGLATPILEVDLPGSALGVDLDPSGTRVAVVTKNLHANQVGSTGEVRVYDTGERDLELLEPARLGGDLKVAARQPGASFGLFLIGRRLDQPVTIPGTVGLLHLDRSQRLRVIARPAGADGRSDLSLPIPLHPALLGYDLSVQVAHRVSGQLVLGETVLDPLLY